MTMLSASEIESLRQETKQAMKEMRAYRHKLAADKEQQAPDEPDGRPESTSEQLLESLPLPPLDPNDPDPLMRKADET